jgi:hypothetical protein
MERDEEIKQYLKHKHKGGANNYKGGLYEDFYAVYQIVTCIAKYKCCFDGVELQTQLEDTFVDDLLIAYPDCNVYHQLKNTHSLYWGRVDKKGDIAFDFVHQIDDCKEKDNDFALKLVYSLKESNIGEQVPETIKEYTLVEHFEYEEDLNSLVIISIPLKKALMEIASNGENTPTDELADIATAFLGIWKGCNSKNRVSLKDIVTKVKDFKRINLKIYSDITIGTECKNVLDNIDDLDYHISGRMFYWSIGRINGSCPWTDEMESEILSSHPTNKWKLIELLS